MSHHARLAVLGFVMVLLVSGCGGSSEKADTANAAIPAVHDSTGVAGVPAVKPKVTFVELGSESCIPCKMMRPVMAEVEKRYPGQVQVVFHDIQTREGYPFAQKYGIRVMPTQIFLDAEGAEYSRHEGYFPFEELDRVLKQKGVK